MPSFGAQVVVAKRGIAAKASEIRIHNHFHWETVAEEGCNSSRIGLLTAWWHQLMAHIREVTGNYHAAYTALNHLQWDVAQLQ